MTIAIEDAAHPIDAAALMKLLPSHPRLLALGEPTHGEDVLLGVRNDLFRQLVEGEGVRTITIESDCMRALIVDDYVTAGIGSLDQVMSEGFSHGFGDCAANRDLVSWMRTYNESRPAPERVHFAGFDGPLEMAAAASPRQALNNLHAYLAASVDADLLACTAETLDALLGADDQWTNPAVMMDPTQSVGRTREAERLRLIADELADLLDTQMPTLIAASSRDEWNRARMYARTAAGLLRYHHAMADASPARMTRLLNGRASMMAANLLATVAERGPVLAFAHNSHLQRPKSTMRMGGPLLHWWSAGAIAQAHVGEQRYAFVATALGTIRRRGVDAPPADTIEGFLYQLPQERSVVDTRRLAAALSDATVTARVSPWFGYAPLDPAHLPDIDALVFVKDTDTE